MDVIAATAHSAVYVISGYGSSISATIGASTVAALATTLQMPIVVVAKTTGNRSRWPIYRLEKLPQDPKFAIHRHTGTMYYLKPSDACSENMTGIDPIAEMVKNISMTRLVCMHLYAT